MPEAIWEAINLTDYAVETRYPGPAEPVTKEEYRDAVTVAGRGPQMGGNNHLSKAAIKKYAC